MAESGEGKGSRHTPELNSAWTKTHQLEGDGMLPLLYHHLWKKNKSFQSCPGIKLPDTVVYEHNFPRAWYTYDFKNSEILKRAGRFLDTHHIYQAFSKTAGGVDICAQYLFTSEGENGSTTSVEFMNPKDLEYFLNLRKSRPDGILQKFLPTAGCNAQIQVIWSPRVTLIQRRVNKNRIEGRNISAYQRAVTYDGPTHLSDEGLCSGRTKNQILEICSSIVDHFTSTEHKSISRFVIYFKVSPIPKQAALDGHSAIWLLWASSLRIGDTNKHHTQSFRPLNLSPNLSTEYDSQEASTGMRTPEASQLIKDELAEVDHRQMLLSNDTFFAPRGGKRPHSAGSVRRHRMPAAPAASRSAKQTFVRKRSSLFFKVPQGHDEQTDPLETAWWTYSAESQNAHDALQRDERNAKDFIDDTVYALYSHLLRKNKDTFFVHVPDEIRNFFEDPTDLSDKLPMLLGGVLGMVPYETVIDLCSPLPEEYADKSNIWVVEPENVPPFGMQICEATALVEKLTSIKMEQLKAAVLERYRMDKAPITPKPPEIKQMELISRFSSKATFRNKSFHRKKNVIVKGSHSPKGSSISKPSMFSSEDN